MRKTEKNIALMTSVGRKLKRRSTDDDTDVNQWSDLPNELLESIKKRLFFADHQNLSAVCKSWSSIEEKEKSDVPPLQQMPWLLVFDETDDSCKLVDSKYKKTYTIDMKSIKTKLNIKSFDKMQCHESKYGWLLISSNDQNLDSTRLFMFSPFMDENNNFIELPVLGYDICLASFTSNPLDFENCTVVTLNTYIMVDSIVIGTYRRVHGSWKCTVFTSDQVSIPKVKHWMYTEGMFYYVSIDGIVGTFDLAREVWSVFPMLPAKMQLNLQKLIQWRHDVKIYMVKSGGELFLILDRNLSRHNHSSWFFFTQHIYRLDLSSMIWEDLDSVGERVLFIGDGYTSVLNSSVLKSDIDGKGISNAIYYCSLLELKYCNAHDYTVRNKDNGHPRRQNCSRYYGKIVNGRHRKLLIDPPPPFPSCQPH